MAGSNITGQPNTKDYVLGRGIIYLGVLNSTTGAPMDWRDIGNATQFVLSIASEKLEHQSSRQGLKVTDKEVEISRKTNVQFTIDELNFENISLFFSGTQVAPPGYVNPAIAGFAEWTIVPAPGVVLGRWYDITTSTGNRAYGIDKAKLTVKNGTTLAVLVENTDILIDAEMGRVFLLSTAAGIAAGVTLKITLTADAAAKNVDEVRMLTTTNASVALKFIGANPADADKKTEVQIHKTTLKGEGDFNLISDTWTTMQLSGVAEANSYYTAQGSYGWIRAVKLV